MKRKTPAKDSALKRIEERLDHLQKIIDNHELDYYLNGDNIRGKRVDESEDILPEHVAVLGAYTELLTLRNELTEGTENKPKKKVRATVIKDGKEVKSYKGIPKEVVDELRELLDEIEGEENE